MVLNIFAELNKRDTETLSTKISPYRLSKISVTQFPFHLSMLTSTKRSSKSNPLFDQGVANSAVLLPAIDIFTPSTTLAAPATVGVILQRLPISKEIASFGSCGEGS
jgi:hypothetical protein